MIMPAKKRKAAKAKPRTAGASTLDAFNKKKKPAKKKPAAKPKRRS